MVAPTVYNNNTYTGDLDSPELNFKFILKLFSFFGVALSIFFNRPTRDKLSTFSCIYNRSLHIQIGVVSLITWALIVLFNQNVDTFSIVSNGNPVGNNGGHTPSSLFYAAVGISIFQILFGAFICFFKRKIFGMHVGFFSMLQLAFMVDILMMVFNIVAIITSYVRVPKTMLIGCIVVVITLILCMIFMSNQFKLYVAFMKNNNPNYDGRSRIIIHEGRDPKKVFKRLGCFAAFYGFVVRVCYFCYAMVILWISVLLPDYGANNVVNSISLVIFGFVGKTLLTRTLITNYRADRASLLEFVSSDKLTKQNIINLHRGFDDVIKETIQNDAKYVPLMFRPAM
ncbi:hypothetical protein C1645_779298 [Glomus cerebriforme]|uniref:Uncharacterized protein n=1 Tax=Glomus cerebriforme TaxID=658196 RepID=A0A397SPR8_9GLOM|nr:hypothetical protein C1645_779298 [Glomus cerebriforme]